MFPDYFTLSVQINSFTAWWQGKKDIDEEFVNIIITNTRNLLVN